MRLIDADRALEIVRDQGISHPNAYHLTNYATLILREAPTITDLSKCIAFNSAADGKPQTNADCIRSMSDEELAKYLVDIGLDCHLCAEHRRLDNEPFLRGEKCDEKCAEHCLEWLQQPAR